MWVIKVWAWLPLDKSGKNEDPSLQTPSVPVNGVFKALRYTNASWHPFKKDGGRFYQSLTALDTILFRGPTWHRCEVEQIVPAKEITVCFMYLIFLTFVHFGSFNSTASEMAAGAESKAVGMRVSFHWDTEEELSATGRWAVLSLPNGDTPPSWSVCWARGKPYCGWCQLFSLHERQTLGVKSKELSRLQEI